MYNEFFGFSESPFNITPNSRFYYRTSSCEETLKIVRDGIETRKGVIIVTGEPGTGKTLFLKSLARDLGPTVRTVLVYNPHTDLNGLLRLLLNELDPRAAADDGAGMFDRLTDLLIAQRRDNRTTCLLIDEAQDLDEKTLDELRLLSNLDFEDEALLSIVLLGQPELHKKLDAPSARRIKQRVALTRHTYPLIRREIGPYVQFRLKMANYQGADLFGPLGLEKIAAYSGGIQRMVNSICDNCLIRAYAANQSVISPNLIDQVAREMRIVTPSALETRPWPNRLRAMRTESAPVADDAQPVMRGSPAETLSGGSNDRERLEETAVHPQSIDAISSLQTGMTQTFQSFPSPDNEGSWELDGKAAPERAPESRANAVEFSSLHAQPDTRGALISSKFLCRIWASIRPERINFRLCWYAVAAILGFLVLALGINVGFSQWAGIYSAAAIAKRASVVPASSRPHDNGAAARSGETVGFLTAPWPPHSPTVVHRRVEATAFYPRAAAETQPGIAPDDGNRKRPEPAQEARPRLARNGALRRAETASSPGGANGTKSSGRAMTVKVVSASLVRNKPTAGAEIISTLEPGSRVRVIAMSRDYYQVRSLDKKPIRGYVHREDAFFDRKK